MAGSITDLYLQHAGARMVSPAPVHTVLVAETPAATHKPKLFGGQLTKKTVNTFPTPEPTPKKTPAPDTPTLKELLMKVGQCARVQNGVLVVDMQQTIGNICILLYI